MKRLTIFCLALLAASCLFSLPAHDARFLKVAVAYELHEVLGKSVDVLGFHGLPRGYLVPKPLEPVDHVGIDGEQGVVGERAGSGLTQDGSGSLAGG